MFQRLLAGVCALLLAACGQNEPRAFTFTAIPDQDESRLVERFGRVADHLSAELGVPVKYVPVKSYAAAVTAFRNDQVQLAWFGGLTGVQARRLVPDSQAIAQGYEDQFFVSYIIAHASTGLTEADTLPDLTGRSFTFGSKSSTSGRLMPEYFLRQRFDQAPDDLFSRVGFSGDHSATIALVESGAYELGAVNYKVWDEAVANGEVDPEQVRVIWKSPTYLDYHWVVRGDVDDTWGEDFTARLRQTLLDIQDPDVLAAFPRSRFVPASNADYSAIADTAEQIGLLDAR